MSILIKEVKILNWGPVDNFYSKFKKFVVIYAKNEKGKTSIIEGIITALFKDTNIFTVRGDEFKGLSEVRLQGLENKETVFKSNSTHKLDKYLKTEVKLFPLVCVVDAHTQFFENTPLDIFDQIFFSSKILRTILKKLPSYIKIENNKLIFEKNLGLKREINDTLRYLHKIEDFLKQFSEYSLADLLKAIQKKKNLEQILKDLERKKSLYKKYISEEYNKKLQEKNDLEKNINRLENEFRLFQEKLQRKSNLERKLSHLKESSIIEELAYLQNVKEAFERLTQERKYPIIALLAVSMILFFLSILLSIKLSLSIGMGVFLSGCIILILFTKKMLSFSRRELKLRELKTSWFNKYNSTLSSMEEIVAKIEEVKFKEAQYRTLKEELKEEEFALKTLKNKIITLLSEIDYPSASLNSEVLQDLRRHLRKINEDLERLKEHLVMLREVSFPSESAEDTRDYSTYDFEYERNIEKQLSNLNIYIQQNERYLQELKNKIASFLIAEDSSIEGLIRKLKEKHSEFTCKLEDLYIRALSIALTKNVVSGILKKREKFIEEKINSSQIKEYIRYFTLNRYKNMVIDKGEILLVDFMDRLIPFSFLSKGAREQICMALRLGITQTFSSKKLFFILDDAFVYSDWERRANLVNSLVRVYQKGHQVIYFTMDDYTLQLFKKYTSKIGEDFQLIELN